MAEKSNGTVAAPAAQKKLSKSDAVKKSFAKLGRKAMPKAVQAYVKKEFGLDVSDTLISRIKTELSGKPAAKKPAATPPAEKAAAPKAEKAAPAANGRHPVVSIDDVLTLKAIVVRVGASHVKTLIDAMSS